MRSTFSLTAPRVSKRLVDPQREMFNSSWRPCQLSTAKLPTIRIRVGLLQSLVSLRPRRTEHSYSWKLLSSLNLENLPTWFLFTMEWPSHSSTTNLRWVFSLTLPPSTRHSSKIQMFGSNLDLKDVSATSLIPSKVLQLQCPPCHQWVALEIVKTL